MFARATGVLFLGFGLAGAAAAQAPLPPIDNGPLTLPALKIPLPDDTSGVKPEPTAPLAIPPIKPTSPALGTLPNRISSPGGKEHSVFEQPAPAAAQPTGTTVAPGGVGCAGPGCTVPGCNPCQPCQTCCDCYPQSRIYANMEWLYWVTSGQSLPPLVSAAPLPGTGALVPGATVLFGNQRANNDWRNGFRVTGGVWLGDCNKFGIEGDFFFIGDSQQTFAASGTGAPGAPILARPFFNVLTGLPDSQLVAAPGLAGTVTVNSLSQIIGAGVNARHNLCCNPCGRVDLIYGYRYFSLTDDVTITEDLLTTVAQPLIPAGFRFQIRDHFRTVNEFHGGVLGVSAERQFGSVYLGVRASCAIGGVNQSVLIEGSTVRTPPGGVPTAFTGGLLAQASNIGRYERTVFAVLPELGLRAGIQLTDWLMVYGGYNLIYLSDVARAGDQIDLRVNPNQLPPPNGLGGPALPAFAFKSTDFWVQGISAGIQLRY